MNPVDDSPIERLQRALAAAAPPKAVLDALDGEPPEVGPGQLWRARRGTRTLLVLVSAADAAIIEVSPVTIGEVSDTDAVDLAPGTSALNAPLTVWLGMTRQVPMRTLEQYTGALTVNKGRGVLEAVAQARRADTPVGTAADPAAVTRAGILDTVEELTAAPLPSGTGELAAILKAAHVGTQELGALLAVPGFEVLKLRRGQRAISADEADRLAPVVNRPPGQLLESNPTPPEALLTWMSHPAQRPKITKLAEQKHIDEDTAFSHATFSTFALAARTAGDRTADSAWAALGQRYFQSVLNED